MVFAQAASKPTFKPKSKSPQKPKPKSKSPPKQKLKSKSPQKPKPKSPPKSKPTQNPKSVAHKIKELHMFAAEETPLYTYVDKSASNFFSTLLSSYRNFKRNNLTFLSKTDSLRILTSIIEKCSREELLKLAKFIHLNVNRHETQSKLQLQIFQYVSKTIYAPAVRAWNTSALILPVGLVLLLLYKVFVGSADISWTTDVYNVQQGFIIPAVLSGLFGGYRVLTVILKMFSSWSIRKKIDEFRDIRYGLERPVVVNLKGKDHLAAVMKQGNKQKYERPNRYRSMSKHYRLRSRSRSRSRSRLRSRSYRYHRY